MKDKILEAIKNLLPADQFSDAADAITEIMEESYKALENEFDAKLEEAYSTLAAEKAEAEKVAYEGYTQAAAMIEELNGRLASQNEAWEAKMTEQYAEAVKIIKQEREKNSEIENKMYEEYDSKFEDMKEFMVDKIHEFLEFKGKEIYEQAKRDILNDSSMAEHRLALDKIVSIASDYITEESIGCSTGNKLDEARSQIDNLNAAIKKMEARNIKLSTDNTRLTESLRHKEATLTESVKATAINEEKERLEKAKKVTGKGQKVVKEKLIAEFNEEVAAGTQKTDDSIEAPLTESEDKLAELLYLAKVAKK